MGEAPAAVLGFIELDPARLQEGADVVGRVVGHVAHVQEQFGHAPFYSATRTGRRAHALSGRRLPPPGASPTGSRGQEISRSESASSTTFSGDPPGAVPGSPLPPATTWSCFQACASRSKTVTRLRRSEEHTSELQSLMRISYAVFCLKKKNNITSRS